MSKLLIFLFLALNISFAQVEQVSNHGKVTFRVQYSFGTNSSSWHQEFLSPNESELSLRSEIDSLARNFSDIHDRNRAIGDLCAGKSFEDKVRMGRYLGDQFFAGHDPNKNSAISTNQVWNAYGNRLRGAGKTQAGTSGDHTLALGRFLEQCGISKDRIAIERFQTAKGTQQMVTVLGDDGKLYSLNYSELYSGQYHPFFNSGIESSSGTIAIQHTRYDATTGEVIDTRMTELGHILMAVTGGKVDTPDYIPELLQIEANYGVLTAGAYMANTMRGEFIRGVKLAYDQKPFKWLHLKAGLTYAHSELNSDAITQASGIPDSEGYMATHNVFMQFRGTINIPDLQILKREDHKLFIDTNIDISAALAFMWTKVPDQDGNTHSNIDQFNVTTLDSYLVYRNHRMEARVGGGVETSFGPRRINPDEEGSAASGMFPFPFMRGKFIRAEFTLKGDKLDIKAGSKLYFFSYGLDQRYYLAFLEKKRFLLFNVGILNHTNNAGNNFPFLNAGLRKEFQINKVGRIGIGVEGMTSLSRDPDYGVMFNLSYTPDFRDHSRPNPRRDRQRWRDRRREDQRRQY